MNRSNPPNRRDFIQWAGAGLGAFASRPMLHPWMQNDALAERMPPKNPILLESAALTAVFDPEDALPYMFRCANLASFRGELFSRRISATVCDKESWSFLTQEVLPYRHVASPQRVDFLIELKKESRTLASFTLRYELKDSSLFVSLHDVKEFASCELLDLAIPCLVSLREEDGPSWLAHADDGGSLVSLSDAKPGWLPPNTFWGDVMASLPVVMLGQPRGICILETTAFMDGTLLSVSGNPGRRRALLGTVQRHRVNGSLCYDLNTGPNTPRNCGNSQTPNLLVSQTPACRIDFLAASSRKPQLDWLDAASLVRDRMPEIPTRYYDGKFIYGIRCDEPKFEKPSATFKECESLIREISALTDGAAQIAHLWGWQYRGKDTGYPAIAQVNARVGTADELNHLLTESPKYNCRVTFSDNYDDAYRSSPAWDPAIIAKRPDGQLWESRNWTGENSYIIGLAKYMSGPGTERVRFTCEHYGIKETIHVDVLSYFTIRNDWDPAHPASGFRNLVDGRFRVIDEFRKYGVDVSSEAMRYAAIGKISFFWHIANAWACPFGGSPIPLQPMIYRRSALWGEGSGRGDLLERTMSTLFYNGYTHFLVRNDSDRRDITDAFYLNVLPWLNTNRRQIQSFRREGSRTLISLEGDARIEQDWAANTYSVSINGAEIANTLSTSCPLDATRIAFYSLKPKELDYPLPPSWNPREITALALSTGRPEPFDVSLDAGKIRINVPGRRPVIVFANSALTKQRLERS